MAKITKLSEVQNTDPANSDAPPASENNPENNQIRVNIEELQKYNIFFATPCYGGV